MENKAPQKQGSILSLLSLTESNAMSSTSKLHLKCPDLHKNPQTFCAICIDGCVKFCGILSSSFFSESNKNNTKKCENLKNGKHLVTQTSK